MFMYIYVYIYIYICIYMCMHLYLYIYICTIICILTCICTYMNIHICIYTNSHIHIYIYIPTLTYIYTGAVRMFLDGTVLTCARQSAPMYTYLHLHINTHTHTHICIYMHVLLKCFTMCARSAEQMYVYSTSTIILRQSSTFVSDWTTSYSTATKFVARSRSVKVRVSLESRTKALLSWEAANVHGNL